MNMIFCIVSLFLLCGCVTNSGGSAGAAKVALVQSATGTYTCPPGIRPGQIVSYMRPDPVSKTGNFHFELFGYQPNAISEEMWKQRETKRAPASYGNPLFKLARKGEVPFAPEWATVDVTVSGVHGEAIGELMLLRTDLSDNTDRFVGCIRPAARSENSVTFTDVPVGLSVHSIVVPYGAMLLPDGEVGIIVQSRNFKVMDASGRFEPKLALDPQTVFVSAMFRLVPDTKGTGKQECDGDGKICVGMIVPFEVRSSRPVS